MRLRLRLASGGKDSELNGTKKFMSKNSFHCDENSKACGRHLTSLGVIGIVKEDVLESAGLASLAFMVPI
jgi:hypothetical protein